MSNDSDGSGQSSAASNKSMPGPHPVNNASRRADAVSDARHESAILKQIIESSLNEIYVFDARTLRFQMANHGARSNLGYTIEEFEQLTPFAIKPGFNEAEFRAVLEPLVSGTKKELVFETIHERKNGTTYPVEVHLQLYPDESPPVYAAIILDITERRKQLASVLLRDRAMAEVDVGIIITDASKEGYPIVFVNQALSDMTGYTAAELINGDARWLQGDLQDQPERLQIQAAQKAGVPVQVVLNSKRKDGTHFMDEISVSPVRNEIGELTHFIGIHRDITSKLETDARLRHVQRLDAIGQLSSGIAHDFNNLLNIVAGNLEFLRIDLSEDEKQETIAEAEQAVQMGARLTRRLLTFASQGTLEPRTIDLNEQVLNAASLLHSTIGESISLSTNLSTDLWPTKVDPSEIENTVVNLAINSRDALPEGGRIIIETANITLDDNQATPDLQLGDYVRLSVSDNGVGMSPDVKARMFEPFYTTKGPKKGTGLGLASIYGFTKQSGGHITVNTEPSHGTTIHVYLPRHSPIDSLKVEKSTKRDTSSQSGCVLAVEDNPQMLKLTAKRLAALGYRVLTAKDGLDAIEVLKNSAEVNLVFSDVVMAGGMSGYDVGRWVRDNLPQCKILLTSGFNEQIANEMDQPSDSFRLLQKPYNLAELEKAVSAALKQISAEKLNA